MAATVAIETPAFAPVPVVGDDPAGKPAKATKAKTPKEKKASVAKKPALHPTYLEMVSEAIASLKERTGSSQYAIAKFVEDKHKSHLPANFKKLLLVQLRKLTAAGKLTKVKNSYKISAKPTPAVKPKSAATKPKSAAKKVKKAAVKPKPKSAAVKPKPKSAAVKPKPKSAAVKPKAPAVKPKSKPAAPKPKTVTKSKTVALKPKTAGRPAKAAKTSVKAAPGKKAAPVALKKAKAVKKATAPKKASK